MWVHERESRISQSVSLNGRRGLVALLLTIISVVIDEYITFDLRSIQ